MKDGYHLAWLVDAVTAGVTLVLAMALLRRKPAAFAEVAEAVA